MKTIILQTLAPLTQRFGNSTNYPPLRCRSFLAPLMLVCFALCQQVQSAVDTPDPGPLPEPIRPMDKGLFKVLPPAFTIQHLAYSRF